MSYSHEDEDLHECCAVDCAQAGTEFLIIKSWALNRYGGKDEKTDTTATNQLVTSGYYCKNHMAEKLESLTRRYRPSSDTGTTNVNLAATTPRQ